MDWIEIIDMILQRILVPLITLVGALLSNYIIKRTKNERIERITLQVTEAAKRAVAVVGQTFVDDLKKSGEWSPENAKKAANMALEITKEILGEEAFKLIDAITDEVDDYLRNAIEQAVRLDNLLFKNNHKKD